MSWHSNWQCQDTRTRGARPPNVEFRCQLRLRDEDGFSGKAEEVLAVMREAGTQGTTPWQWQWLVSQAFDGLEKP